MITPEESSDEPALRAIAEMIADYRKECLEAMQDAIVKECKEVVDSGFDPAQGSGRGPWWAAGD